MILAPIVLLALVAGLAKVALTLLLPSFATSWASMGAFPISLMRDTLAWLAKLPWSEWPMPAWPLWGLFLVYGIYVLATPRHVASTPATNSPQPTFAIVPTMFSDRAESLGLSVAGTF